MTNKLSLRHFLHLFLSVALISCTGEDESDANNPDNNNDEDTPIGLTIGNDFYPLRNGHLLDYGNIYDGEECSLTNFNLDVRLYQEGVSYDPDSYSYSGTGKSVEFYLFSDNSQLANGNYADMLPLINTWYDDQNFSTFSEYEYWDEDNENENDNDDNVDVEEEFCEDVNGYVGYRAVFDIDDGNDTDEEIFTFTSGEFSFSRNTSGEITIRLTGATTDGTRLPVSIYYKGFLTYVDRDSDDDKRPIYLTKGRK